LEKWNGQVSGNKGGKGDADLSDGVNRSRSKYLTRPFDFAQDQASLILEHFAQIGDQNTSRMTLKKLNAEVIFERFHGVGKRGLGNMETLGGARNAAGFHNYQELR